MIKSTPHAHTTFVDGRSTPEEMVFAALERGFSSLGFSEHGKQRIDEKYGLSALDEGRYIAEINRLKGRYSDRIRLYLGVERDFYATSDRADYDYVIGSFHYFARGAEWMAIDWPKEMLLRGVASFFGGNGLMMARTYYKQFAAYVESYKPDIIGHFDLIRKNNSDGMIFDGRSEEYLRIAREAMEHMVSSCDVLEVNTGGMARGYMNTPYPDFPLLQHWRGLNGRVILSSDCHDASKIDFGYDEAIEVLKEAGFKTAVALSTREGKLFEEYEL